MGRSWKHFPFTNLHSCILFFLGQQSTIPLKQNEARKKGFGRDTVNRPETDRKPDFSERLTSLPTHQMVPTVTHAGATIDIDLKLNSSGGRTDGHCVFFSSCLSLKSCASCCERGRDLWTFLSIPLSQSPSELHPFALVRSFIFLADAFAVPLQHGTDCTGGTNLWHLSTISKPR